MKAEITATGTLVLTPENGTEAYALRHWMGRLTPPRAEDCRPGASVIQVDLSAYPSTLPLAERSASEQRAKDVLHREESQWRMEP